ncbi:MAG: hypothetical protein MI757_16385 [Pirellulales bacterium]|nr:hypothetical protein [Pirellulales bacterium]
MLRSVKVVFAFSWLFVLAVSVDARGDENSLIRNIRVGFDGVYKVGHWTTV